jgi:hypothetical protein
MWDKTGTNNLTSNVCLVLLQVYNYSNLDKTGAINLDSNVWLEFLSLFLFKFGQDI